MNRLFRQIAFARGDVVRETRVALLPVAPAFFEEPGVFAEFAVRQELFHEVATRVFDFFVRLFVFRRERLKGLDFDERARRRDEVADRFKIEFFQSFKEEQKLIGDLRDRYVEDVELPLAHQVQEEVEGPVERV